MLGETQKGKESGRNAMNNEKMVALTFDDGPNLTTTNSVLDIIEIYHITASFFLIGQYINKETKQVMERELSLGCEIHNHSWSHPDMTKLTLEQIKEEVDKTNECIYEMVGVQPKFFRPPYIAINDSMYEVIQHPFISGINCMDWDASVTAEQRTNMLLEKVQDGDIILLHDLEKNINTVKALPAMIKGLIKRGYTLVTISELFQRKGIDPNKKYMTWSNCLQ